MKPIQLYFSPAIKQGRQNPTPLNTFSSYTFDRNIFTPAAAFRFIAPGVDKQDRLQIRSGDTVYLVAKNSEDRDVQLATGFIDETDTHINATNLDYSISGRDTIGQLVDNAAVDDKNIVIILKDANMRSFVESILKNTRIPSGFIDRGLPNKNILFQTNPGETKINSLQRYLEMSNCLIWSHPDGRAVVGKPDFSQKKSGNLTISSTSPSMNNCIEARVKRNVNQSVRQIIVQLQELNLVDAAGYTIQNNMKEVRDLSGARVGRSIYETFSYGAGHEAANQLLLVGDQSGNFTSIGNEYALRTIARENTKVLNVDIAVEGHLNSEGQPYNIDQIYSVFIDDEDINEDMYVYACSYELTMQHGMMTRLQLCKLGTIVASAAQISKYTKNNGAL